MKIRTAKYMIKEGGNNLLKNILMSLASVSVVSASLFIFGIFLVVILTLGYNIDAFKSQLQLRVTLNVELNEDEVNYIENEIKANGKVMEYKKTTKAEYFEKMKEMLTEDDKSVVEGLDESFLPVTFTINMNNPDDTQSLADEISKIGGVSKVYYPKNVLTFVSSLIKWINSATVVLTLILLVISMVIISNTIKLTVFARRREIGIMKYIGATDWFIRLPFIAEGVIIGLIGAVTSFVVLALSYNMISTWFKRDFFVMEGIIFKTLSINQMALQIISIFSITGIVVGILGSIISIRKYLRV